MEEPQVEALVERCRRGEPGAWDELLAWLLPRTVRLLRGLCRDDGLAEDLAGGVRADGTLDAFLGGVSALVRHQLDAGPFAGPGHGLGVHVGGVVVAVLAVALHRTKQVGVGLVRPEPGCE